MAHLSKEFAMRLSIRIDEIGLTRHPAVASALHELANAMSDAADQVIDTPAGISFEVDVADDTTQETLTALEAVAGEVSVVTSIELTPPIRH